MPNTDTFNLTTDIESKVKGILFTSPRELSGAIVSSIDQSLEGFTTGELSGYVDNWYKSADAASYTSNAAAAAYLGAYGPRSILKYQEAVFALVKQRGNIQKTTRVIDFGAGPSVGFAALIDLWDILSRCMGEKLKLEYIAVDRSEKMLEVGESFCELIKNKYKIEASYKQMHKDNFNNTKGNIFIISNVMNDGEGNENCGEFLTRVLKSVHDIEDLVIIEPATEQPSRQMCGLGSILYPLKHIGPCYSNGSSCSEWSFREFPKRVYNFERLCAGQWASAAYSCKYSLSLFSKVALPRELTKDEFIVIGHPNLSGFTLTCKNGIKQVMRVSPRCRTWDVVDIKGQIKRWWP